MTRIIACLLLLAIPGCVGAATDATVSQAQSRLQAAIDLYGVAKGIGQVASLVDPAAGLVVAAITATTDPVVAGAQAALTSAATDAGAIEALSAQITAQANAITVRAAPSVVVIPAPTSSSKRAAS